jgi:hypothetical protein
MAELVGSAGAEIKMNIAPAKEAFALKHAIEKACADRGLDLSKIDFGEKGSDVKELLPDIVSIVLSVDSDSAVHDALFGCLARSTYNKEKIILSTFDTADARGDYYVVTLECLKENILPFFSGLASMFEESGLTIEKILT